jgi:hypothetical protein
MCGIVKKPNNSSQMDNLCKELRAAAYKEKLYLATQNILSLFKIKICDCER